MKKFFLTLLFLPSLVLAQQLPSPALAAKSWLLIESASGQELASQAADERLEPASLTKLMSAYLVFAALREGRISLEDKVLVSEKAWRTGGSRMFIRVGTQVSVDELIKGMIVQSGNDASVALAEAVSGSEEEFARAMNREAERLAMRASHFTNSTGLPDPGHYTTARDLALLAGALLRDFPEEYARYYALREYRYNNITQPNRNRLLWLDSSVDGMKTGHTEAAGYCLISSAKRGQRRLLAVVLGASTESARAQESLKLLNFGFQSYDAVKLYAGGAPASSLKVWKGAAPTVPAGFADDFVIAVPKGQAEKIKVDLVSRQPLLAPVASGEKIGTLKVSLDGKPLGEYPVQALAGVPQAGAFGRAIDTLRLWFN